MFYQLSHTPSLRYPPFDRKSSDSAVRWVRGDAAPLSPMLDFLIPFILWAGGRGALDLTDRQTEARDVTFPTA